VIDGAQAIQDLAEATASGLTAAGPTFSTAGSDSVNIDLSLDRVITRTATGAITFTGSNYTEGKSASVRIVAGASSRNLTFPAGWVFVSGKPATLAANKTGILAVTAFGTTEASVVAAWAFQP
jgi:hypothetical protein